MADNPLKQQLLRLRILSAAAGLVILAAAIAYLALNRQQLEDREIQRVQLHARVLETQTEALLESASTTLGSLVDLMSAQSGAIDAVRFDRNLRDALQGRRVLRSLSVLDLSGRVLSSSTPENVDIKLDLAQLGWPPAVPSDTALGPLLAIRDLGQLGTASGAGVAPPVFPMVRHFERPDGNPVLLVALLNADRFSTQFSVLLGGSADQSALFSYAGQMLAAGIGTSTPGERATPPAFKRFLPRQESGAYEEAGLTGRPAIGAFRTLRTWPLVVVTEQPAQIVWERLLPLARTTFIVAALLWLSVVFGAWQVAKGARARHASALALEDARLRVAAAEERWHLALEGSDLGVWDMDLRTGLAVISPRMMTMLGYPESQTELRFERWHALMHPDDLRDVNSAWAAHVNGDSPTYEAEYRMRAADGHWTWILSRGSITSERDSVLRPVRILGTNQDISRRREAEAALRASQARQQAIQRSALDAIVTVDGGGRVIEFNPAAEAMFGYTRAQVVGRVMEDLLVPPRMRRAHVAGMERYRATGEATILNQRREVQAMRSNGTEFPAELAVVPVETDAGEIFTATIRDLTDRKRIEEQLQKSDAQYRVLFDNAAEAIWVIQDGRVVMSNPTANQLVGREAGQVVGAQVTAFVPDDLGERVAQLLQRRQRGDLGGPRYEAAALQHQDGSLVPVEISAVRIEWDGRPATLSFFFDISERQAAEQALRESEARFRGTFEQAAIGMLQQARDRRFVRVNQTLCDMLGYTREEFLSLPADQLVHPEDLGEGLVGLRRLFAGEIASFQQEKRFRRRDGSYIWVLLTASILRNAEGTPLYMLGAVEDITERRRAQADLAAARERELEIGNRIQRELLVEAPPESMSGLMISAYNHPSQGIDGDFFEMFHFGDDTVDIIAGDVMGKGVTAALLGAAMKMQFSRSLTRLLTLRGHEGNLPEPSEVVQAISQRMTPHLQALESFITLAYVRVNVTRGTLTWIGCGHEESLLIRPRGESLALANQHPPMGVLANETYRQDSMEFREHDALFLCSDGAADALLDNGERVGREALNLAATRRSRVHGTPAMALHGVRRDLLIDDVVLADDVTMVMVMRGRTTRDTARLEVPISLERLTEVRHFVEAHTLAAGLVEEERAGFTVAAIEVFTNIVRHSTGRMPGAPLEIVLERTRTTLILEFSYFGDEFVPPREAPEANLADFPEGGFGLFIIEQACDEVQFSHAAGVNNVRLAVLRHR